MADNNIKIIIGGDAAGFATAAKQAGNAGVQLSQQLNKSTQSVHAFSQLLREAPAFTYDFRTGLLALSNNIPIFVDSIQGALKSGQSFGSVLGTVGKSLFSFGNLLTIGISALTIFGDKIFGSSEKTKKAADDLDEYNRAIKGIVDSVGKEAAQVGLIVNKLQAGNVSRRDTIALINELKSIAPDYFGKLNSEKSSVEEVTKAYNGYNQALVTTIETQIKLKELNDSISQRLDFERNAKDAAAAFNALLAEGKSLDEIGKSLSAQFEKQNKEQLKLLAGEEGRFVTNKDLIGATNVQLAQMQTILDFRRKEQDILKSTKSTLKDLNVRVPAPDKPDEIKPVVESQLKFSRIFSPKELDQARRLSDIINGITNPFSFAKGFPLIPTEAWNATLEQFEKDAKVNAALMAEISKLNLQKAFGEAFRDFQINAFSGIGEALGNIFTGNGGIENILGSALESASQLLSAFGKAAIAYGVTAEALKVAFQNPAIAITAGIGLIAASQALRNSIPKFADGGIVKGATLGIVGEAGPEAIIPIDRLPELLGNVNTAQPSIVLQPSIAFQGDQFRIMLNQVDNRKRRI